MIIFPTQIIRQAVYALYTACICQQTPKLIKMFEQMNNPKVGDLVVEISNWNTTSDSAVGELLRKEYRDGDTHWLIRQLDGKEIEWNNAKFISYIEGMPGPKSPLEGVRFI